MGRNANVGINLHVILSMFKYSGNHMCKKKKKRRDFKMKEARQTILIINLFVSISNSITKYNVYNQTKHSINLKLA